ncbi:hypothetical protein GCM10010260_82440 [Streptomyces filipinensis]|uniref:Uncharacterized protein n=1 Tax=Streptomyces filipinensis TaxID=66887 RepID=A0A918MGI6_9ACTN|nr:hypothetical protein GCM10010260_82440 [Streptomyces filipinensis]
MARAQEARLLAPVGRPVREDLQQAIDLVQEGLTRAEAAGLGAGRTLRLGVFGHAGRQDLLDVSRPRNARSGQAGRVRGVLVHRPRRLRMVVAEQMECATAS